MKYLSLAAPNPFSYHAQLIPIVDPEINIYANVYRNAYIIHNTSEMLFAYCAFAIVQHQTEIGETTASQTRTLHTQFIISVFIAQTKSSDILSGTFLATLTRTAIKSAHIVWLFSIKSSLSSYFLATTVCRILL